MLLLYIFLTGIRSIHLHVYLLAATIACYVTLSTIKLLCYDINNNESFESVVYFEFFVCTFVCKQHNDRILLLELWSDPDLIDFEDLVSPLS